MRLFLALILVAAACGGDDSHAPADAPKRDAPPVDAPIDAAGTVSCDPIAQDCPTGMKCAVYAPPDHTIGHYCVPNGTVALGGTCHPMLGNGDDCIAGLGCADDATCHTLCTSAHQCAGTDACIMDGTFDDGLCAQTCTSTFDAGSCPAGQTCDIASRIGGGGGATTWCRAIGPQQLGEACPPQGPDECAAGLVCALTCLQACDDHHPCPGTLTCHHAAGVNDGGCAP